MEVTSTVEFVPPTVFKVDLKEENRANEVSGDVGDAEVQVHCSAQCVHRAVKIPRSCRRLD